MTNNKVIFVLSLGLMLSVLGCKKDKETKDKTKKAVRKVVTRKAPERRVAKKVEPAKRVVKKTTAATMAKDHYRLANKVLDAVIEGDIPKAQKAGQWLAAPERLKELPTGWAPHWKALQESGKTLAAAKNQQTAALAVANVAASCGSCHTAMKAKITPKIPALKDAKTGGTKAYMLRHIWSTARFWEGLSVPSDSSWMKGAVEITKDKYLHKKVSGRGKLGKEIKSWAKFIYKMGKLAQKTKDTKARTKLMGSLLQGCVHCHKRMYVDLKDFPH